jgi:5-methylcytosine-specific restriction endonuclease McrA
VVPSSRGGPWTWLNTVAACRACNGRKADRTPVEAGMRLRFQPYVPTRAQLAALDWAR